MLLALSLKKNAAYAGKTLVFVVGVKGELAYTVQMGNSLANSKRVIIKV